MPRPSKKQQEAKKQAELQAQQEADEKAKAEKELLESAGLTSANVDETPSEDDISDDGIHPEQEKSNVSTEQEQPNVDEKPVEPEKTSDPKAETKKKVKIADHMMKINGVFYQAGDKLPVD